MAGKRVPTKRPGEHGAPDAVERVGRPLHVRVEESGDAGELFDPRRILVPLDFSAQSDHALGVAIRLARTFDAELSLLHACELPAALLSPMADAAGRARLTESLHTAAEDELEKRAQRVRQAGLAPHTLVATGTAASAICDTAREIEADLVVMATRGRSALAEVLMGSVAERTIHRAPCPVLIVRAPEDAGA